jgi:hypothetical protein
MQRFVGAPFFRLNPLFGIAKALDAESVLFDTSDYQKPVKKQPNFLSGGPRKSPQDLLP